MGDAVDRDRLQPRIAKDDFVMALRRRVAQERRFDILFEQIAHVGQLAQQFDRFLLGQRLEIDGAPFAAIFMAAGLTVAAVLDRCERQFEKWRPDLRQAG